MALAQKQEQFYTTDYIYNLPEGERAELIDGVIYNMAPPNTKHQIISSELSTEINYYIKSNKGSCRVFTAPFAVFLNEDDTNYLEPDISVICDPGKLDDRGCNGAPDWIIEITSPSNASHDYITKLGKYKEAGVREYWIVNPQTKEILVYFFEKEVLGKPYTFQDKIKVNIYDDLTIDFSKIELL